MAKASIIGDLFVITVENDVSEQTASTVTIPRGLTVEYITVTVTATGGAGTVQIESSPDGTTFTDMFGGAVNLEINNVQLVAQTTAQGAGTCMLVPSAGQSIQPAAGANGALRVTIGGNNQSYKARFFCSASTPTALTVA